MVKKEHSTSVMKNKTYAIRYNHTSKETAGSKSQALYRVRAEMRHMGWGRLGKPRYIECEDGLYCYMSAAEANADSDGSRAFAVITGPNHRD